MPTGVTAMMLSRHRSYARGLLLPLEKLLHFMTYTPTQKRSKLPKTKGHQREYDLHDTYTLHTQNYTYLAISRILQSTFNKFMTFKTIFNTALRGGLITTNLQIL